MDELKTQEAFNSKRQFFDGGKTKLYEFRIEQLKLLKATIYKYENEILEALSLDLHKSKFEGFTSEVGFVYEEINYIIRNLKSWMKPKKVSTPMTIQPSKSYIYEEPLGVVLIIGPWNYPFQLIMVPLIGAIASGNCVILKPSNQASYTARIVEKIISEVYQEEYISVIQGSGAIIGSLLVDKYKFNHIFFTGSQEVGKKVLRMASKHLTPVTLELGGKSPVIVDKNTNLDLAAKKLSFAKFYNAGQTCVCPDYLLIHEEVKGEFIKNMIKYIKLFYGEEPIKSEDFGRIINEKRFNTLRGYLKEGQIIIGGEYREEQKYISPTIIDNVDLNSNLMNEEIFGPILPVIAYREIDEVINIVRRNRYPLALYLFTEDRELENYIIENIEFGGGCINDGIVHLLNNKLPFGGVGNSGIGRYHGKYSFETFSHKKSIVKSHGNIDIPLRYPPYSESKLKLVRRLMK